VRGRKKDGLGEEEKLTDNTRLGFLTKQWNRRQKAGGNPRIGGDGARVDGKSAAAAVARERGGGGRPGSGRSAGLGWGGGSAPLSSARGLEKRARPHGGGEREREVLVGLARSLAWRASLVLLSFPPLYVFFLLFYYNLHSPSNLESGANNSSISQQQDSVELFAVYVG
jgi:hypothetical protein